MMPVSTAVSRSEASEFAQSYLPGVVQQACEKFEIFHRLEPGVACAEMIDAQSSLKVPGWAAARVADWSMVDSERRAYEEHASG